MRWIRVLSTMAAPLLWLGAVAMADAGTGGARVTLEQWVGGAHIRLPAIVVDASGLPPAEGNALADLLGRAAFFDQPERFPAPGYPDAPETRLTVEEGGRRHAVTYHEGDGHPPALNDLAAWVKRHGRQG